MTDSDDGFVTRWSRRKRDARTGERADPAVPPRSGGGMPELAPPAAGGEPAEAEASDLPDPDTLDADADFTVFLKDNVPEAIRRRALRRLWRLNPVFANLDGLNDYDDDFTDAATVVAGLKTLYQVGKGFVTEDEEAEKADDSPAEAATGPGPNPEGSDQAPDGISAEAGDAEEEAPVSAPRDSAPPMAPPVAPSLATAKAAPATPSQLPAGRRGARERRWGGVQD